jgi:aminoglycoside phosphotransferase (APT) family kinase protein
MSRVRGMPRDDAPSAEVAIDETLVRALLVEQHPDLSTLPLALVGHGWDNTLYKLGDSQVVRLPRRSVAAPLIEHEHRWLAALAPHLTLEVPAVERVGRPGCGYPWAWGICRWIAGRPAAGAWPLGGSENAQRLAAFLHALHRPSPPDAPVSPFRGTTLASRTERLQSHLLDLAGLVDEQAVRRAWNAALAARPWSQPPTWVHGDLHPANVIVDGKKIVGVIDFGDITAGDPATDLACAWMLFTPEARWQFREALRAVGHAADDDMWARASGWALALNLAWLTRSEDDPETTTQALGAIESVVADSASHGR